MVFQKSNPFPKSIFENIAYGLRINGMAGSRSELAARVEESLQQAALWDEVKDRLHDSALAMSGGQQQRLCIARALAVRPDILLMDEPASALDPIATQRIEELVYDLKKTYTIVIVTHNMQQAARVSDYTAFFWLGRLVEYDRTDKMFTAPAEKLTEDYVTGTVRYSARADGTSRVRTFQEELEALQARLLEMGGLAEERVRAAVHGLVTRDTALIDKVMRGRRADQRAAHRDRQPVLHAAGAVPADGDRPAGDCRGRQDRHRPRAGRRPGGEHRRSRPALCPNHPPVKKLVDIPQMGDIAQAMLRDALDSFVRRDTAAGPPGAQRGRPPRRAEDAGLPRAADLHAGRPVDR